MGRWLSRDPIQERGGVNLHAFVRNDPLARFDAFGLIDEHSSLEEIEREARGLVDASRRKGRNVAADNLENFLNGGGDRTLDVSWLRSFGKVTAAERKNEERFIPRLREIAGGLKCGESQTFSDNWDALISYGGLGVSSEELFWASGDSSLRSEGSCTLTKQCETKTYGRRGGQISCETIVITGVVNHRWRDRYDWNAGAGVWIYAMGVGGAPLLIAAAVLAPEVTIPAILLSKPAFQ